MQMRGGVSVVLELLIPGLSREFDIVLVSPDSPEELRSSPVQAALAGHITWEIGRRGIGERLAELTERLQAERVEIAHLHCGGVYGWGNRFPWDVLAHDLHQRGIRVFWTSHLVVNLLKGFCGNDRWLLFKLSMLPLAWLGKVRTLEALEAEIAVSQHDVRLLRERFFTHRQRFLQVYHSRLSSGDLTPSDSPVRERSVLSVGHVAFRKGQHRLAQAFAEVAPHFPDWRLDIVGPTVEPECEASIRSVARVRNLEQRIRVVGPEANVLPLMRRAGIFVQPSLEEGLGLALQEATACGCACIGTQIGGIPELVSHGRNGLLCAADNPAAMARELSRLMGDAELASRLGSAGPALIRERGMFVEETVRRHSVLYRGCLPPRKRRPRIVLATECPITDTGGVEVLVRELLERLPGDLELLLVSADSPFSDLGLRRPLPDWARFHLPGSRSSAAHRRRFRRWLRDREVDLVHFHLGGVYSWETRSLGRSYPRQVAAAGLPILTTNHGAFTCFDHYGPQWPLPARLALFPKAWLSRLRLMFRSAAEITVSQEDRRNMARWFFPARNKLRQIYHSRLGEPQPVRADRERFFLALGTIGERKGQRVLLAAFRRLVLSGRAEGWTLRIAGRITDDPYSRLVCDDAADPVLAGRVELLGRIGDESAHDLLGRAGVFVMPSFGEGLGLALQEAVAAGCPAVGSRVGGIPELIEHGENGLLVPPGDPAALADALAQLAADAGLRARLGARGPELIRRKAMTTQGMVDAYDALYRRILRGERLT